ncbi:MAG: hypothetical protein QM723_02645 [Myxococcaceae bacterium]
MRTLLLIAAFFVAGCSSPTSGDNCNTTSDCGKLTCLRCNAADAGSDSMGTCHNLCTTDADCAGTSGHFGSTPVCGSDLCGNKICSPQI